MKRALLEPVMALHYGEEIALSRRQRSSIEEEVRLAKAEFSSLQTVLERELRRLHEMLEDPELQEEQATAQLDRVLELERRIKHLNLLSALKVRAQLTSEQRLKLQTLPLPPPPPPPPPPLPPHKPPPPPRPGTAP